MKKYFTRKNVYLLNMALVLILVFGLVNNLMADKNGRTGRTSNGCGAGCHANSASTATTVTISSGSGFTVAPSASLNLTVRVAHSTLVAGGFDASVRNASTGGTVVGTFSNPGSGAKLNGTEVTHSAPKLFSGGGCDFTFTWTAPSTPGTYYLQVAGNAVDNDGVETIADTWNLATQTITVASSGSVVVVTPNGGENACQGGTQNIQWTSTGVTNVMIELSTDGGSTYPTVINPSISASAGSYIWNIPANQVANSLNKIRVSDASNSALNDVSNANFTINATTAITNQPQAQTACVGSPATMLITVNGTGLNYLWKKDGIPLTNSNSGTYTIASVKSSDAGSYLCEVTGTCGSMVASSSAILTVKVPPTITTHPLSKSVCVGSDASIWGDATGDNLTFKWQKNGVDVPGATSKTLTLANFQLPNAATYKFFAISTFCNSTVSSNDAVITTGSAPGIAKQPVNSNFCEGTTASLYVVAVGSNLTYQWYQNGISLTNENSATLTIPNALPNRTGNYFCKINGTCDPASTSNTVTLNINSAPVMLLNPTSKNIAEGGSVTFTVSPKSIAIPITYQWYKGANLLASQTNPYLILTNIALADAGDYYCKLTNDCGSISSGVGTLTVQSAGNGILNLANNSIVFGEIEQGKSDEKTLTDFLSNTGKKALKIVSVTMKGSEKDNFTIKGLTLPTTIDINKTQSISILFTPGNRGLNIASADFTTEDNQVVSLALSGKSSANKPGIVINKADVVLNTKINQTVSTTLTLSNNTNFPEVINSISLSDNNYKLSSPTGTFTLNANKSQDLVVDFSPKITGNYSCTVTIKADFAINAIKAYITSVVGGSSVEYDENLISDLKAVPNPIESMTNISFDIPQAQSFEFKIVDAQGKLVKQFVELNAVTGNYLIKWDGTDNNSIPLASGVYYGIYQSNNKIKTIILNIKR